MKDFVRPKRHWTHLGLGLALLLAVATPARAFDVAGVQVESRAALGNLNLVLNGAGLRKFWLFDMYVAALYLPKPAQDVTSVLDRNIPREISITLLHGISADNNVQLLKKGLEANNDPQTLNAIHDDVERFLALIRQTGTFPKGSVIQLAYEPGTGTEVWLNHRRLGNFAGETFNRAVLQIWLGDHPVQPSLKAALLGKG